VWADTPRSSAVDAARARPRRSSCAC